MKKVRDIIVGQFLETISPETTIGMALHIMETKRISSLLVFEGERFRGIVTMVDIATSYFGQDGGTVEDIMTPAGKVVSVGLDTNMGVCSTIMRDNHFHHLVAKDLNGKIVGIVSSLDLTNAEQDEQENAAEHFKEMPKS